MFLHFFKVEFDQVRTCSALFELAFKIYGPIERKNRPYSKIGNQLIGAPGGTRTHNPQIRSLVLYPVELRAQLQPFGLHNIFHLH